MNKDDRRLIKFACKIHDRLRTRAGPLDEKQIPIDAWNNVERLQRMMHKARERDWALAENRVRKRLSESLDKLQHELVVTRNSLDVVRRLVASVSEIYADLMALHDEFEDVAIDLQQETVSVTTPSIVLEGVYLGPFEIVLEGLGDRAEHTLHYRVVTLDPHPAASNDAVTHPHVQDETVCEGDGRHAIRIALEQGRFLDLFLVVANLLETYNDGSPYIPLSEWHGIPCHDCGATMLDDEWWTCEKCDARICEHCYVTCSDCGSSFCGNCTTVCDSCDDRFCDSCLTVCTNCLNPNCQHCLDELERCSDCHESEEENSATEPESDTPVHSDCVVETSIPA